MRGILRNGGDSHAFPETPTNISPTASTHVYSIYMSNATWRVSLSRAQLWYCH